MKVHQQQLTRFNSVTCKRCLHLTVNLGRRIVFEQKQIKTYYVLVGGFFVWFGYSPQGMSYG